MKKIEVVELDLARDLEALVDSFGIEDVIAKLGEVCKKKASEPEVDWERWARNIKGFFEGVTAKK